MRRAMHAIAAMPILAALATVALAGCGSAANGTAGLSVPTAPVTLTSSAIRGGRLPTLYTCAGRNISPPLSWSTLPSNVEEVTIFALGVHDVKGRALTSIEWAIAGVKPGLRKLRAGELPHGAFLLAGSSGKKRYSICPGKGQTINYEFALFALPHGARASPELPASGLLTNLTESGVAEDDAPAAGSLKAFYTRR
jgi:phosphatidylethanolamine-binding protein (PEBP) family uncharacterized protein